MRGGRGRLRPSKWRHSADTLKFVPTSGPLKFVGAHFRPSLSGRLGRLSPSLINQSFGLGMHAPATWFGPRWLYLHLGKRWQDNNSAEPLGLLRWDLPILPVGASLRRPRCAAAPLFMLMLLLRWLSRAQKKMKHWRT